MNLTLNFDSQALVHPDFMASVNAAAAILNAAIANPINVSIDVGYGSVNGTPLAAGSAEGGPSSLSILSYSALRADLAAQADPTNLTLAQALAFLPQTATLQGVGQFFLSQAQAQIFGITSTAETVKVGNVGFATNITGNDLIGVALHELSHALARTQDAFGLESAMGLYRYTTPGVHASVSTTGSTYFSLDGGATNLASYGVSSDTSDFLNSSATANDSFNEFFTPGRVKAHLTPLDLKQLDALGFSIQAPSVSLPSIDAPTIGVGETFSFTASKFQISDTVDPEATYQATVSASHGTVLTTGQQGTITGNGSATLGLSGSLANVNADLALLSFTGTSLGAGAITISANDGIVASQNQTFSLTVGTGGSVAVSAIAPGRAPETAFDAAYYLQQNADVRASGMDAQTHFDLYGWHEGRNPDQLFDVSYYLANNPDVAQAGIDPLLHYEQFGWKEGRNPSASFNGNAYLAANQDVKLAGINPLDHYLLYGATEHRALV